MKDYLTNKTASEELVETIKSWWYTRTGKVPNVWLEKQDVFSQGEKTKTLWVVRSDMKMVVPQVLTKKNSVGQHTNVLPMKSLVR